MHLETSRGRAGQASRHTLEMRVHFIINLAYIHVHLTIRSAGKNLYMYNKAGFVTDEVREREREVKRRLV